MSIGRSWKISVFHGRVKLFFMDNPRQKISYSYLTLIRDTWSFIRPYRAKFLFATFLRVSADTLYLYTSYTLAQTVAFFGTYTRGESLRLFWHYLIIWAVTYAYVNITRQVAKYWCYHISEKINLDSQLRAMKHLQALNIDWHEKENTGNKLKRMFNGGEGLKKLVRIWVDNLTEFAVNFLGMIIIISFIDTTVMVIMILFLISYLLVALPLARRASAASREVNAYEEDLAGLAFETLNNIRSVKAMGMFGSLYALLEQKSDVLYRAIRRRVTHFRFKSAAQSMWAHLFRIICMASIAVAIAAGRYEAAFLLVFTFYFTNLRTSVEQLSDISQDIVISRYHIARLQELLHEPITIDDDVGKQDFPQHWKTISLRNVSFAYGDNMVLNGISFDIRRGERIGVVGLSGAGKSTLFKLLLKEYEDFTGDILFDGVSIRKIKKSAYFRRVAVVLQETEVFNISLKDNITIANDTEAKNEKMLDQALQVAHVTDFMEKLPEGVGTLIGEKGVKLSGGEKQRLGIARAVFKQPDLLFLDEATSHLDLESEEKIKDSLHQFFQNVTAVVIAHRLTTIQEMDRILLIEDGKLLEEGNFAELMKKKGRFFDLWEKQRL